MNRITDLLDLEDENVIISDIQIQGQTKTIILETILSFNRLKHLVLYLSIFDLKKFSENPMINMFLQKILLFWLLALNLTSAAFASPLEIASQNASSLGVSFLVSS